MTSLFFLFLFLPLTLILYYAAKTSRPYVLLLASVIFYGNASPEYFVLLMIAILFDVVAARSISYLRERGNRMSTLVWIVGVGGNLLLLVYYKYSDFIGNNLGRLTGWEYTKKNLVLPLGLSFFTFKAISYLTDVYRGTVRAEKNPIYAVNYLSFFGQMESGPLSRYGDMYLSDTLKGRSGGVVPIEKVEKGIVRFVIGFNKKMLLSNMLYPIVNEVFARNMSRTSAAYLWLGAVSYSLQLYFDFSGYSDMAIGVSWMFGLECPENFRYPYMTQSISEFWRRWHITLGSWFRDYIYIPMGGSRVRKARLVINIFVVWLLTGIWHGANWNFVFWGITYAILICFEKLSGLPGRLNGIAKIIYRGVVLLVVNFEWVIFRADGLAAGLSYIKHMIFSCGYAAANARALFLVKENWMFLIAAILFATPVIPYIEKCVENHKVLRAVYGTIFVIVNLALFLWAVSYVVAGANNPFAYANF